MTRGKTTESLVSALVILLIALVLLLARATAHGWSEVAPARTAIEHADVELAAAAPAGSPDSVLALSAHHD